MAEYSQRLDKALRIAAWAHEQAGQHRKGTDIPYIIHPVGVMTIAASATDDENTLIACLLHDVLEDVPSTIYSEGEMRRDFGDETVAIVKDVTKDDTLGDWRAVSGGYLRHLEFEARDEALIVAAADKIHNLKSTLYDYETVGDDLWQRFTTNSANDQLWWYESVHGVMERRNAPDLLCRQFDASIIELRTMIEVSSVKV